MKRTLSCLSAIALAALLGACGPTPPSPDTVNMTVQDGGQGISGTYRTSGFSQNQVRAMVRRVCTSAGFSGFNQTVNGDFVSFSVACAAPTRYRNGANARFVAQDDGTVDYTITYALNGNNLDTGGNFAI